VPKFLIDRNFSKITEDELAFLGVAVLSGATAMFVIGLLTAVVGFAMQVVIGRRRRKRLPGCLSYEHSISRSMPTSIARRTRSSSQSIRSPAKVRVLGFPQ
jgi:hypothetical protein